MSNILIIFGGICAFIAAVAIPYGFHLKSIEKKKASLESKVQITAEKMENSGDNVAGDKITNYNQPVIGDSKLDIDKKHSIAKIKINRLLDDYQKNVDNIYQSYSKESNRIASEMSGRGLARSGIHVNRQKEYAIETKNRNNDLLTKLTRGIEDVLLESYDSHKLEEISELKTEYNRYTLLREKTKQEYSKIVENIKSWEVKSLGTNNLTKDFTLEI